MIPLERSARRSDTRGCSRKAARQRRARHAQLMADIVRVLSAADTALAGLPDCSVRIPHRPTTLAEFAGCIAALRHQLWHSEGSPITSFAIAPALEAVLGELRSCTTDACDERSAAITARHLLDRWNGHRTSDDPSHPPASPAHERRYDEKTDCPPQ